MCHLNAIKYTLRRHNSDRMYNTVLLALPLSTGNKYYTIPEERE